MNNFTTLFEAFHYKFIISTRAGGHSKGNFSTQNLGLNTDDSQSIVLKNRREFFAKVLPIQKELVHGEQVHGKDIREVEKPGYYRHTDGFIAASSNLALSVVVADCHPVFLVDPVSGYFSLLHMGWKGTAAGILQNSLQLLRSKGVAIHDLYFTIGPGIGFDKFEVGPDVKKYFSPDFYSGSLNSKGNLNLGGFIIDQFVKAGGRSEYINDKRECTYVNSKKYFSYRRDGKNSGRMLALAWKQ